MANSTSRSRRVIRCSCSGCERVSTASGSRVRLVPLVLFLFATAYQVALSVGIIAWLARGSDRGMRPFGITYFTYRIYDVSPAAASQGVRAGDELLATDGQAFTIYVATQFCALLLGFGVALISPRDPIAWPLLVMMVSFASFSASGDVLRDTIRAWPNGFRQVSLFYHFVVGDAWSMHVAFRHLFCRSLKPFSACAGLKWLLIIPIGFGALVF